MTLMVVLAKTQRPMEEEKKQQLGNCYFEDPKSALFLPPVFPKLCSAHAVWNAIHHQERKFVYFRLTAELSD